MAKKFKSLCTDRGDSEKTLYLYHFIYSYPFSHMNHRIISLFLLMSPLRLHKKYNKIILCQSAWQPSYSMRIEFFPRFGYSSSMHADQELALGVVWSQNHRIVWDGRDVNLVPPSCHGQGYPPPGCSVIYHLLFGTAMHESWKENILLCKRTHGKRFSRISPESGDFFVAKGTLAFGFFMQKHILEMHHEVLSVLGSSCYLKQKNSGSP